MRALLGTPLFRQPVEWIGLGVLNSFEGKPSPKLQTGHQFGGAAVFFLGNLVVGVSMGSQRETTFVVGLF